MASSSDAPGGSGAQVKLRAVANRTACGGFGVCTELCPEVFQRGEDGFVTIATELVPPELEAKAREAAASCPESALSIEDA